MEVWLHVGASKTGTSALQVAFAQLRPRMAAAGLWYPKAMSERAEQHAQAGEIFGGNAVELGRLMNPSMQPEEFVDRAATIAWVRRTLAEAEGRVLLFSSETMQGPDLAEGRALLDLLSEGGRRLRILYYVRHALDHCVASFAQWLKVGIVPQGERNLDAYVARWIVPFPTQLETWAKIVGEAAITCRLYDEDRPALLAQLLETVHPPAAVALDEAEMPLVNRSPTASELRLLLLLNAESDAPVLCRWLTEGVLNAPSAVLEPLHVSEAAFAAFKTNNTSRVEVLNARWLHPACRMQLRLTSGQIGIGPPQSARTEDTFAACFIGAARRMEQQQQAMQAEISQLKAALQRARSHSEAS